MEEAEVGWEGFETCRTVHVAGAFITAEHLKPEEDGAGWDPGTGLCLLLLRAQAHTPSGLPGGPGTLTFSPWGKWTLQHQHTHLSV